MSDHLDLTGKVILNDDPVAARGGFADVFKGYCPTMDKKVAVKRLRLHVGGNWDVIKVRSIPCSVYVNEIVDA